VSCLDLFHTLDTLTASRASSFAFLAEGKARLGERAQEKLMDCNANVGSRLPTPAFFSFLLHSLRSRQQGYAYNRYTNIYYILFYFGHNIGNVLIKSSRLILK
jgi:hypothetical protein